MFDRAIVGPAIVDSFRKLNPRGLLGNPVIFVVEVGSVYTSVLFIRDFSKSSVNENVFAGLVTFFLWATVLFANFAEAMAEGRGRHSRVVAQDAVRDVGQSPRCRRTVRQVPPATSMSATSASSWPAR